MDFVSAKKQTKARLRAVGVKRPVRTHVLAKKSMTVIVVVGRGRAERRVARRQGGRCSLSRGTVEAVQEINGCSVAKWRV